MGTLLEMWKQSIQLSELYIFNKAPAACPPGYRLPTKEEQEWLIANTKFSLDEEKEEGVFLFADGFELRLPAAGYWDGHGIYNQGLEGNYWSSSPDGTHASSIHFEDSAVFISSESQNDALSVRCVPIEVEDCAPNKDKMIGEIFDQTDDLNDRMTQIFIRNGSPILDLNQLSDEDLQEWLSLKKQSSELVNRIRKLINKK